MTTGETIGVTLSGTQDMDCNNRAPFLSFGLAGSSISVNALQGKFDDSNVTNGFEGFIPRTEAGKDPSSGAIVVKRPPINVPKAQTWFRLLIEVNTDHGRGKSKPYSVNHEILYLFEEGYVAQGSNQENRNPGNINRDRQQSDLSECDWAEQELGRLEQQMNRYKDEYVDLVKLIQRFRKEAIITFCVTNETGQRSSLIKGTIGFENKWQQKWLAELNQLKLRSTEGIEHLFSAIDNLELYIGLNLINETNEFNSAANWDEITAAYDQVMDIKNNISINLEDLIWDYYCNNLVPIYLKLDKVDEAIVFCPNAKNEALSIRYIDFYLLDDWKENRATRLKKCRDR